MVIKKILQNIPHPWDRPHSRQHSKQERSDCCNRSQTCNITSERRNRDKTIWRYKICVWYVCADSRTANRRLIDRYFSRWCSAQVLIFISESPFPRLPTINVLPPSSFRLSPMAAALTGVDTCIAVWVFWTPDDSRQWGGWVAFIVSSIRNASSLYSITC